MAKNDIPSFSTTASNNTDIGGVGLNDNDSAANLRDAIQQVMRILKRHDLGEVSVDDTWLMRNAADTSKTMRFVLSGVAIGSTLELDVQEVFDNLTPIDSTFTVKNAADATRKLRFSGSHIPTATTRVLDAEALNRNGSFIQTVYSSNDTHEFASSSRYFQILASGGGGGGGGVKGSGTGTRGAASGGSSGFFGSTAVLEIGDITEGTVVIGSGGDGGAGSSASDGSNGTSTTWVDGTNSYAFGGGKGGKGVTGDGNTHAIGDPPNPANSSGGTIFGTSNQNTRGHIAGASTLTSDLATATGGVGGSTDFGVGGNPGKAGPGGDATGFGSGGGGAGGAESGLSVNGGDGAPGILIVREW